MLLRGLCLRLLSLDSKMAINNRRRGRNAENEFTNTYGKKRISEAGVAGPDVLDKRGNLVEVKRIKAMPKLLQSWINQARTEGADLIAFRANRGRWYIIIEADQYYDPTV